ncbi:MAG: FecR domain-containing protein [Brucellaceae bacterium]|jgi:transmembrane sensor|nr:FecR domain-containing protein [Brucellaceae bacterium]
MTFDPQKSDDAAQWSFDAEKALEPSVCRAIEWFTLLSDGAASEEIIAAHCHWLTEAPENAQAYEKVQKLWVGATQIHAMQQRRKKHRISRRDFGKLTLLAVAGLGSYGLLRSAAPDFETANGESRLIVLKDDSQIRMSGGTALSVKFSSAQRDIILHSGEAYFSVARGNIPFSVYAASGRVTALGTKFNIALSGDQAEVLVTEHAVQVDYATQSQVLRAGEKLTYEQDEISVRQKADAQVELSWLEGRLVFIDKPLGDVVHVLNRWSSTRLRVIDRQLAQRPVTLIVNIQDIDNILPQLKQSLLLETRHIPFWGTLLYSA